MVESDLPAIEVPSEADAKKSCVSNELVFNVWNWIITIKTFAIPIVLATNTLLILPKLEYDFAFVCLLPITGLFLTYFFAHRRDA